MIRKPEAKNRAELLMRELTSDGFTLKRGRALDIVAKLEGCRDWNTFCAADTSQPAVASGYPEYAVGNLVQVSRFGRVDDVCLAAFLQHSSPDDHTTLYILETPEGNKYELRLCGSVMFGVTDPKTQMLTYYSSANGLTEQYIEALALLRRQAHPEFLRNPYFEWINEDGDPVVDVSDTIWVNVKDEVREFLQLMGISKALETPAQKHERTSATTTKVSEGAKAAGSLQYTVGDISHLAKDGEVSDLTLAAYLRHSSRDDNTQLLTWTSPAGEKYTLQLCSCVRFDGLDLEGYPRVYSSVEGLTLEFSDALDVFYENDAEFLDEPYFEWVRESGDPVGGVFSALPVNALDEVADLKRMLSIA